MSEPDPIPENPAIARAEFRLRRLERLSEIGMELAESLRLAPGAVEDFDQTVKRVDAFATASRFVRLTISLETTTDLHLSDLKAGIVRAQVEEAANRARASVLDKPSKSEKEAREGRVARLVAEAIETEAESEAELCELSAALTERLDYDDVYWDCGDRPVRETVERLCKDLGMNPDMSRWDEGGEGWIDDGPPKRKSFSPFNKPSRKRLLDDEGEPLEAPAPPPLHNGHDLE
jgi:hypothetical protein